MAAIAFPRIDPVIFSIGDFSLRWYGVLWVLPFLGAYFIVKYLANVGFLRADPDSVDRLIYFALFGGFIGGHLGYLVFYQPSLLLEDPLAIFKPWQGGMASHGGLIGVFLGCGLYAWKYDVNYYRIGDAIAQTTFTSVIGVRLGNFINGELYGRVTDASVPWAMRFPTDPKVAELLGAPEDLSVAAREQLVRMAYETGAWNEIVAYVPLRHPSQIYELVAEGILLSASLWAVWLATRERRLGTGVYFGFNLIGYWVARTVCEFFRQPDPQFASNPNELGTVWAGLSMGQLLSIFMLVGGVALVVTRWKHRVPDEPWRPSEQREPDSAA
jgi:phosphatidylglycerol:prolipoprotein diacylglycerol transferase